MQAVSLSRTGAKPVPLRIYALGGVVIVVVLSLLTIVGSMPMESRSMVNRATSPGQVLSTPTPLPRTPLAGLDGVGLQMYSSDAGGDTGFSADEISQLADLRRAGVQVIRYGVGNIWWYSDHSSATDTYITRAKSQLAVLTQLGFTVVLEIGTEVRGVNVYSIHTVEKEYPVDDGSRTAFTTGVNNLLDTYAGCPYYIRYFELGNEEDLSRAWDKYQAPVKVGFNTPTVTPYPYNPQESAQNYVAALALFRSLVKTRFNDAVVVNGGLAYSGISSADWTQAALIAGLGNQTDLFAFHFYPNQYYTFEGWKTVTLKAADVQNLLQHPNPPGAYAPVDKALWVNESGLTSENSDLTPYSNPPPPTPPIPATHVATDVQVEAGQVVRLNAGGAAANSLNQIWFLFRDFTPTDQYYMFSRSGVIDLNGQRKPAFASAAWAAQRLGTWKAVAAATYPNGIAGNVEGYTFRNPTTLQLTSVLWDITGADTSASGQYVNYSFTTPQAGNLLSITNMYGTPVAIPAAGTPLAVNIDPLYINWTTRFTDVNVSDTFYPYITLLVQAHIMSGYDDATFRPNDLTTRAQTAKLIVGAAGWPLTLPAGAPHFSDVPPGSTFYPYIEVAWAHGILGGYSDGTFRPGNSVTRGQVSKMLVVAQGWTLLNPSTATFTDVPVGSTFYQYVETAVNHTIASGYACGGVNPQTGLAETCDSANRPYFRPGNNATRGQMSKMTQLAFTVSAPVVPPTSTPTSLPTVLPYAGTPITCSVPPTPLPTMASLPNAVPTSSAPLGQPKDAPQTGAPESGNPPSSGLPAPVGTQDDPLTAPAARP